MPPEPMMLRINEGVELRVRGEHAAARALFGELWTELGPDGDPLHRCSVAHSMADVQDEVADELAWDRLALHAAAEVTDERLRAAGMPGPARALLPSLHLNLAEAYRKLGEIQPAREHLEQGLAAVDALPEGGYGQMITNALHDLSTRLAEDSGQPDG